MPRVSASMVSAVRGSTASSLDRKRSSSASADVLAPGPQRRHQRSHLPGAALGAEPLELGGDDPPHPGDLPPAPVHRALGEGLEVVHVEERHAGDAGDGGIDVAGDGDVDDRAAAARSAAAWPSPLLLGDHDLGRSGRRQHEVGGHQRLGQLLDRDRPAADPDGQLGGPVRCPGRPRRPRRRRSRPADRAMPSPISPAPSTSTRRSTRVPSRSTASATAADDSDTAPRPMPVSARDRFPTSMA